MRKYLKIIIILCLGIGMLAVLAACSSGAGNSSGAENSSGSENPSNAETSSGEENPSQPAGTDESSTPSQPEGGEATAFLHFSSFDGGGYDYRAEVADPAILECTKAVDYGSDDHEEQTGSAFDVTFSFTGRQPGTTTVSVFGRSPILENDDSMYTAVIDDGLRVTLTPLKALASFDFYRTGDEDYNSYLVTLGDGGYVVSVNEEPVQPFGSEAAADLMEIIEKYDLEAWDGFDEPPAWDGDRGAFWLEIRFTDGTSVSAHGDHAFPEHYSEAAEEIQSALDRGVTG